MPAVRHPGLWIHPLDDDLEGHVPIAGHRDLAMRTRAWCERTFKLHAEPGAELFGVGKRAPNTRAGCAQNDLFLDAVGRFMQLHGCILGQTHLEMQPTRCIHSFCTCRWLDRRAVRGYRPAMTSQSKDVAQPDALKPRSNASAAHSPRPFLN